MMGFEMLNFGVILMTNLISINFCETIETKFLNIFEKNVQNDTRIENDCLTGFNNNFINYESKISILII